ncbi:MAG: alpha-L-fucosidase [Cytophagia bacterium]|nr:alpha-L-fucosidase [Cytophagia bacterium]NBW37526.1 alpha-L-fucosidase [Cytophagia bacterium]
MSCKYTFFVFIFLLIFCLSGLSQGNVHQQSTQYVWPEDSLVRSKLEKWRDQKFGIIIHWGLYAVPGIVESWTLCSEDVDWIGRDSSIAYDDYKKWYWNLKESFNPRQFDPSQWAKVAKDAGMRYVVFTTKHHDGFAMFNTQQSDFSIAHGPFADHPKADVAKHVFEAFRQQDFMIGAYFSKPDWHSEFYWWPKYATADRNVNYDIRLHPWRWQQFKDFTFNQLSELMHNYGAIDILWLDGGWVRPLETVNDEVRAWGARIPPFSQHIDMPRIAQMARKVQSGILMVDRTVHGAYENYQTPEQSIPKVKSDYPWESCITLGNAWGYVPNDQFKSSTKVIHTLIEVVAKGGSLLLGVGPDAQGLLQTIQVQRLQEIGKWLKANGEAIYNTRTVDQVQDGETFFTKSKNGSRYALVRLQEGTALPTSISWHGNAPDKNAKLVLLSEGITLKWKQAGDLVTVYLPASLTKKYKTYPALVFKY